ncbi:hypothetical protein KP79_PYT10425 [Mizuhopecten yessoensis]|uniref:DUF4706 domain-containing protein n=1 Tax=Mizuhopecten yessoensis TaxID=6573 RepID=A0A210PME9_MIZYE|nr:hypothetical protein KP79_PYT10425 [Mizuhopecten yessoensis]
MEEKALAYFASVNPLAKKVIHETQLAKNILNEEWDGLDWKKQEEALDAFFVDRSVREKYVTNTKDNHYAVSFPKLFVQSGEKIIVDMDSDIWSWQDVHSAPFSWRSKSQQDLTLSDLDPEKLSKPQPSKGAGKSKTGQENEERPTAPPEFLYHTNPSIWESDKYKNWKSDPNNFILPEIKDTYYSGHGNVRDSCVSDVLQPSLTDDKPTENQEQEISHTAPQPIKKLPKKASSKSPVATRLKLSSSFSKRRQEEEQELVTDEVSKKEFPKAHKDIESNAFDNPAMNIRGQNLMDEETESISSTTSSPSRKPLLREPRAQMMEREEQTDLLDGAKRTLDLNDDQAGLLEVTEFHGSVLSGSDRVVLRESESVDTGKPTKVKIHVNTLE